MTQQELDNLIQGMFDGIFDSVTKAEVGGKPLLTASTTVLSLMKPGMAIRSSDFANPWTPGNLSGSKTAAVNTAALADVAPAMSTLYADSGNSISKMYSDILDGVQVPAQPPSPAIEQQLESAYNVLFRTVTVTDPDDGTVSQKVVESQLYRDYLDNQSAYMQQRSAYMAAYLAAQSTQTGMATWPMLAPSLQIPVRQAYDKWRAAGADKVEQAIAIQNTSSQNALSKAFHKAKAVFEGYGVLLEESGSGLSELIHRSSLLPSDWYKSNPASKGVTVDTKSGSFYKNNTSDFSSGGGSVGFNLGIFSIGGGGGHSEEHRHMTTETSELRFSYEYTLVTIRRPWMAFHLLGTKGWNLQNLFAKGTVSNGSKSGQASSRMPLLPVAFVVARKITISAKWSKADYDFVKKQTQGGGGFGIGPFQIGGSYSHSSTNETFSSAFANGTITVPGAQIIGWISQVVPYCPPT
jgi:hypothetical protein